MEDLELRSLLLFIQAVQTGSFSAAAGKLELTPAAVSKSIARLEGMLGVRLFNRTTRRLSLTGEGRLFYDKARTITADLSETVDRIREVGHEPAGVVRLSTISAFGRSHVMPLLPEFLAAYPRVSLDVEFAEGDTDPVEGGYDVSVRRGLMKDASQVVRRICHLPLVMAASPAYLARHGCPGSPAELADHECISVRFASGRAATWEFVGEAAVRPARFVHQPRGRLVVSEQPEAVLNAALMGLGIAVLTANYALPHFKAGELKLLLPEYRIKGGPDIFIQYPHREYLALKVRVLVDFLLERFRGDETLQWDPAGAAHFRASTTRSPGARPQAANAR